LIKYIESSWRGHRYRIRRQKGLFANGRSISVQHFALETYMRPWHLGTLPSMSRADHMPRPWFHFRAGPKKHWFRHEIKGFVGVSGTVSATAPIPSIFFDGAIQSRTTVIQRRLRSLRASDIVNPGNNFFVLGACRTSSCGIAVCLTCFRVKTAHIEIKMRA
jgi:hypothetical protein